MARNKGILTISGNFEPRIAAPFDARIRVETQADLLSSVIWDSGDGNEYLYNGLVVAVYNDTEDSNNALYMLVDKYNYDQLESWKKINTEGIGPTGPQGSTGSSVYDIWLSSGGTGSETDFLDSLIGPQGLQGDAGQDGPQGLQGDIGPQGLQGDAGQDGPQGPQGDVGPQGLQGDAGQDGPQGLQGDIGPQGLQGDAGQDGPQGLQGDAGQDGPQGPQGDVGPQGLQGDAGQDGPQGLQGDIGPQGLQGDAGQDGPQGLQGDAGQDGPQGPQGDVGPQGLQGEVGQDGPQGPQGDVGPQGLQGDAGQDGPQGLQGDAGQDGPQGLIGPTGPQGVQGPTGASAEDLNIFYEKTLIVDPLGDDSEASLVETPSSNPAGSPHKYFNTINSAIDYANTNYSSGVVNIKVQAGEYIQSDSLVIGNNNFEMSLELDSGVVIKSEDYTSEPFSNCLIKMIGLNPSITGNGVIELGTQSTYDVNVFNIDINSKSYLKAKRINKYNHGENNSIFYVDNSGETESNIHLMIDSEIKSYSVSSILNLSDKNINSYIEFSDNTKLDCLVGNSPIILNNNGLGKSVLKTRGEWVIESNSLLGDIPIVEYYNENCEIILDGIELCLIDENDENKGYLLDVFSGLSFSGTLYFSSLNTSFINSNILSANQNNIYNKNWGTINQNVDLIIKRLS